VEETVVIPSEEIHSSPTVEIEEDDVADQEMEGQAESDEDAAHVQYNQVQRQQDLSSFPSWLRQRIEESTIIETYQPALVEELLMSAQKSNKKKTQLSFQKSLRILLEIEKYM